MFTADELAQIAKDLANAYACGKAIDPPIRANPGLTVDDAYDIQMHQINARIAAGAVVKGYKVGLTSKAMQDQLGVNQPDFGHLMDDMFHLERVPIDASHYLQPKVEPEIAFVIGKDLAGPGVNVAQAMRAVDFVVPSLELIDSRVVDWQITIVDTIADNASSAGVILGSRPTALDKIDLTNVECRLSIDTHLAASGISSAVLGSPINAVVWLANTLGAKGISFKPGDVILPGSITPAQPVRAGTIAYAEFAKLGAVTAVFE